MAVKKTKSATATKPKAAATKTASLKKSSAKPKGVAKKPAPKKNVAPGAAIKTKKASPKKASAPKLNPAQAELLRRIGGSGEAGYLGDKKAEARTLEALRTRKLVKRGAKDKATGGYSYTISSAGKKHPDSSHTPSSTPSTPSSSGGNT